MSKTTTAGRPTKHWYQRLGPGLITACVVIGPGSILTSSKVGSKNGFDLWWVVAIAVIFMQLFMQLGAKLGGLSNESACTLIANRAGRWLAVLIGLSIFFISASFQFGNNLGVHSAFKYYLDPEVDDKTELQHNENSSGQSEASPMTPRASLLSDYTVVIFNAVAIGFLFLFKNLYRALERLMMCFVGLMLLSFALNLGFAFANMPAVQPVAVVQAGSSLIDISLLGLVGTTFVIAAAFYQSYLVQQKGWGKAEMQDGLIDARVGAILMALITLMIMSTAAAVLRGKELNGVDEVANQLAPLFGSWGRPLFCMGLFSAAYSSFLVNSMIGGFILSDGLGFSSKPTDLSPRLLTTAVLLTGMGVALYVIKKDVKPVAAIVAAQAVTVIAAPLIGGALLWLTNRKDIMGEDCNGPVVNIVGGIGFLLLLAMAWYTAVEKVLPQVQIWLNA